VPQALASADYNEDFALSQQLMRLFASMISRASPCAAASGIFWPPWCRRGLGFAHFAGADLPAPDPQSCWMLQSDSALGAGDDWREGVYLSHSAERGWRQAFG
jgi:hypothetical protein